jgi:hypothetical protein
MGTSTLQPSGQIIDIGKILMVAGVVALAIGFVAWKATTRSHRA